MAVGKPLNRKSFYGSEGIGDIAMPPLDQSSPAQEIPNPWDQQQAAEQGNAFGAVPDELPEDVRHEMQQEEVDQEDQLEQPQATKQSVQEPVKETSVAANMRALREGREKAERERDELMKLLQIQMQQNQPRSNQPELEPEVELPNIDDDSLVEGKYLNKINQKYDRKLKSLEEQLYQYKAQSAEAMVEARIKAQFPDFEKVVSKENVEMLRESNPEIAKMLSENPDMYTKAVSAYKVIKQFGIHRDESMDSDRARAAKNSVKPRPLTSVNPQQGDSPLSKANAFANGEFSAEMKEQLRREMLQARKNH